MSEIVEIRKPLIFPEDREFIPQRELKTGQESLSDCLRRVLAEKVSDLPTRRKKKTVEKQGPVGVLTEPEQRRLAEAALAGEETKPQFTTFEEKQEPLPTKEIRNLETHLVLPASSRILASSFSSKEVLLILVELFQDLVNDKARELVPEGVSVADSSLHLHVLGQYLDGVFLSSFAPKSSKEAKQEYLEVLGRTINDFGQGEVNLPLIGRELAIEKIAEEIRGGQALGSCRLVIVLRHWHDLPLDILSECAPLIDGDLNTKIVKGKWDWQILSKQNLTRSN